MLWLMKVVINNCFGGFGLSPQAVRRLAELDGRACYIFINPRMAGGSLDLRRMQPVSDEKAATGVVFYAFDIPNPDEVLPDTEGWSGWTDDQKAESNSLYRKHSLKSDDVRRDDPRLVRVVEELGELANGHFAELKIIDIPDGVDWTIEEYDGREHVSEVHRTWV